MSDFIDCVLAPHINALEAPFVAVDKIPDSGNPSAGLTAHGVDLARELDESLRQSLVPSIPTDN